MTDEVTTPPKTLTIRQLEFEFVWRVVLSEAIAR